MREHDTNSNTTDAIQHADKRSTRDGWPEGIAHDDRERRPQLPTSACLRARRSNHKVNLRRKKGGVQGKLGVAIDKREAIMCATHHLRVI